MCIKKYFKISDKMSIKETDSSKIQQKKLFVRSRILAHVYIHHIEWTTTRYMESSAIIAFKSALKRPPKYHKRINPKFHFITLLLVSACKQLILISLLIFFVLRIKFSFCEATFLLNATGNTARCGGGGHQIDKSFYASQIFTL